MSRSVAMGDSKAVKDSRLAFGVIKNSNGIDHVFLSTPKGTAQVSLLGAEVTSWRNEKGEELLFRSSKTISEDPRRRLGGISICFPTFASGGRLEQHGFVKNRIWTIEKNPPPLPSTSSSRSNADCYVDLQLESSKELKKFWPHSFMFRLRVCLSRDGDLTLMSRVENTSETAFTFSFAYHTYFSAYEISEIRVENLETLNYKDYLSGGIVDTHQGHALSFDSNVDRFYMSTPESIAVMDHQKKRKYLVRKQGLPDVAVWCPWEAPTWMPWQKKPKSWIDLDRKEYNQVFCVDAAAIEKPVKLKPREEWTGKIQLSLPLFGEKRAELFCNLCGVHVPCKKNIKRHVEGKQHQTNLKTARFGFNLH